MKTKITKRPFRNRMGRFFKKYSPIAIGLLLLILPQLVGAQKLQKRLQQVDDYIIEQNYDYARQLLVKILNKDEGVHQAHFKLALVLRLEEKPQKALEEAVKAVKLKPEEPNYNALLAAIWFDLNEEEKGLKYIDKALLIDSLLPEALLYRGDYLIDQKRYADAIPDFLKLKRVVKKEPQTLYRLGFCHQQLAQYNRAAEFYKKVLKINPIDIEARSNLANCLFEQKKYNAALFELNQCEKLESRVDNLHLRARCYIKQEKLLEAKKDLLVAQSRVKTDLNLQLSLAQVEEMQHLYNQALNRINLLLASYPSLNPLLVFKGRLQAKLKNYNEAYKTFGLAINGYENSKTLFTSQVVVYQNLCSYLAQKNKEKMPNRCDSFALYSHYFYTQNNTTSYACPNDTYYNILLNGSKSPKSQRARLLNIFYNLNSGAPIKEQYIAFKQIATLNNYETIEYHIAEIMLNTL